jgi:hypothetical protein
VNDEESMKVSDCSGIGAVVYADSVGAVVFGTVFVLVRYEFGV